VFQLLCLLTQLPALMLGTCPQVAGEHTAYSQASLSHLATGHDLQFGR